MESEQLDELLEIGNATNGVKVIYLPTNQFQVTSYEVTKLYKVESLLYKKMDEYMLANKKTCIFRRAKLLFCKDSAKVQELWKQIDQICEKTKVVY